MSNWAILAILHYFWEKNDGSNKRNQNEIEMLQVFFISWEKCEKTRQTIFLGPSDVRALRRIKRGNKLQFKLIVPQFNNHNVWNRDLVQLRWFY